CIEGQQGFMRCIRYHTLDNAADFFKLGHEVVLAIREELDIPVKLIGFGEKIDDIGPFHSENFMRGLLEGLI
ncbi:MAG: hypothetical protein E6056_07245, partial [Streptococcus parasanguinis]|nr:hypothetical protein [Streptococcus parasanguinis]